MAKKEISKRRRLANNIAGLGILGGLGWFAFTFFTAGDRVRSLCESVKPGWTIDELNAYAKREDLGPSVTGSGTFFLVEHISHSEYDCTVRIEDGRVVSAEYRSLVPDEPN